MYCRDAPEQLRKLKDTEHLAECKAKRAKLAEKSGLREVVRLAVMKEDMTLTWDLANNWRRLVECKLWYWYGSR